MRPSRANSPKSYTLHSQLAEAPPLAAARGGERDEKEEEAAHPFAAEVALCPMGSEEEEEEEEALCYSQALEREMTPKGRVLGWGGNGGGLKGGAGEVNGGRIRRP